MYFYFDTYAVRRVLAPNKLILFSARQKFSLPPSETQSGITFTSVFSGL
jgi:hypothetical protein